MGTIASQSPTSRTSDRPTEGGLRPGPRTRTPSSRIPGVCPAVLQKSTKYVITTSEPTRCEQGADEPFRAETSDQRRDQCGDPDDGHEDDDGQSRVGRERDRARRDPRVDRAHCPRGAAEDPLGPVVEPCGRVAGAGDHLVGEPGRLAGDRVPELGARSDVAQNSLRLVAREDPVGELERFRGGERGGHEALQLAALGELGRDAFEDLVSDQRARDLLRQRTGERPVDDAGDLGRRENLVDHVFERSAPGTRGRSCREEGGTPGSVGKPGAGFVVLGHHKYYADELGELGVTQRGVAFLPPSVHEPADRERDRSQDEKHSEEAPAGPGVPDEDEHQDSPEEAPDRHGDESQPELSAEPFVVVVAHSASFPPSVRLAITQIG